MRPLFETKVQEYLRRKALKEQGIGEMFVVKSTRNAVTLREREVVEISKGSRRISPNPAESKRYYLDRSPYEIDIFDGELFGEMHGYGTGVGDLWSWSYYCTFDKAVADDLLKKETERINEKYLNKQ